MRCVAGEECRLNELVREPPDGRALSVADALAEGGPAGIDGKYGFHPPTGETEAGVDGSSGATARPTAPSDEVRCIGSRPGCEGIDAERPAAMPLRCTGTELMFIPSMSCSSGSVGSTSCAGIFLMRGSGVALALRASSEAWARGGTAEAPAGALEPLTDGRADGGTLGAPVAGLPCGTIDLGDATRPEANASSRGSRGV